MAFMEVTIMETFIKFISNSSNVKTGAISQTYSTSNTCPTRCPFKNNGCYAKSGHVRIHWNHADKGEGKNVCKVNELKNLLETVPCTKVIRHNVAGDIAKEGTSDIDEKLVKSLINAFKGHIVYAYTHCTPNKRNITIAKEARKCNFIINFSCETKEAVEKCRANDVPAVLTVSTMSKATRRINNVTYAQCPATLHENIQCVNCGKCWKGDRKSVVVFPVHGAGKGKAKRAGFLIEL